MVSNLVDKGEELHLDLGVADVQQLVGCHTQELTSENLMELESHTVGKEEEAEKPPPPKKKGSTRSN